MAGGLINIISYGVDDLFLTGFPEITFFKAMYRRYTNFAIQSVDVPVGNINLNDEIQITIPKIGDLITKTYLKLVIPQIQILKTDTVVDITPAEYKLLTESKNTNLTDDEQQVINDYTNVIIPFLEINTQGYRVAVSNKDVKNQTVQTYITNILNSLNYGDLEQKYTDALNNVYYNIYNQNSKYSFVLNSLSSNIYQVLTNTIVLPDTYSNYTIAQVYDLIQTTVTTSVDVKGIFFALVKTYNEKIKDGYSKYINFAWIHRLGHAIIDNVDVYIGGERIDRHYGDWINVWYELTSNKNQDKLYDEMIGDVSQLTTFDKNAKPEYSLYVPLSFWFCRRYGLAFPLIALQYGSITMHLKLTPFEKIAYIDTLPGYEQLSLTDIWENLGLTIKTSLLIEYIYLDKLERKRFAKSAHEYLINGIDRFKISDLSIQEQNIQIDFQGPSKEIIWRCQKMAYNQSDIHLIKMPFNYSQTKEYQKNGIDTSLLSLNNYTLFNTVNSFNNYVQPYVRHTRTPSDGINVYSFSLFPEEQQPSCTCNFSQISGAKLSFTINQNMFSYKLSDVDPNVVLNSSNDETLPTNVEFIIYTVRYNILRVIGGNAGLAYSFGY